MTGWFTNSQYMALWFPCCCCCYSVTKSCPALSDPWTAGHPVPHCLPEVAQAHVYLSRWCYSIISSSATLLSFAFSLSLKTPSWITALSWWRGLRNSMKLWAMPCRVTQERQITVQSSDKLWSPGGENGKPPQLFLLEKPMNHIKRGGKLTCFTCGLSAWEQCLLDNTS